MPKVSSPSEFGIGRGAGKLGALNLPSRQARASPEAFGAGIRNYAPPAEAFGYGREHQTIKPGQSGFDLLLATVGKLADTGFDTALAVDKANENAAIKQSSLQNRTEWLEQNLAREATIEEGQDPGEYAKTAAADYDTWAAAKTEGLAGRKKLAIEQDLGELRLHALEQATTYQAQRQRQHREAVNKATYAATDDKVHSYYNLVLTDPGQLPALKAQGLAEIAAMPGIADDVKMTLSRDFTGGLAAAMWAGKLEQDPYGTRDAMLRGDVEELGGLEADKRIAYLHAAQVDIRGLEAQARTEARERRAEERERLQDLKDDQRWRARDLHDNAAMAIDSLKTGRPMAPEASKTLSVEFERQIDAAVDPDLKYSLAQANEAFHAALDTSDYADVAAGLPLPRLRREVARLQALEIPADEQTPESDKLVTAGRILAEREDALRQNKTLEYAETHSRAMQLAPVDWRQPQSAVVREQQSTKIAYANGLPHGGDHQRLTESEAVQIAEEINRSNTTDEVLAKLDGYMGRLDDNAKRVWLRELKEKKLSPLAERAMEAIDERDDLPAARRIVGAMTVDPKDLPKLADAAADAIRQAVDARINKPGTLANLSALDARRTQQPATRRREAEDKAAMQRMAEQYVSDGQEPEDAVISAERDLFGDADTAGSDDLGYVRAPKGEDADEFTTLLERARANAPLPEYPGGDLYRDSNRQNIRDNGFWRQGQGGTYELVDHTTNLAVGVFTPNQLRAIAGSGPPPVDPGLVLPGLGG